MARELKKIHVTPGSELARLLEQAALAPLILEKDGERYRLNREEEKEDIWAGYDPEKVRKALAQTAGSWADIDTDALIADIYRAREEGSRPANRP
ncbi:MAG: hypothetical protein M1136_01915 [Chloroflexi bacterium]|nr:hypothetical protein [Chloroflexota bacterium]MCL5074396.1 hypothetical protein [Chloroflexota bacterium]